jgi:hypothetical protein
MASTVTAWGKHATIFIMLRIQGMRNIWYWDHSDVNKRGDRHCCVQWRILKLVTNFNLKFFSEYVLSPSARSWTKGLALLNCVAYITL